MLAEVAAPDQRDAKLKWGIFLPHTNTVILLELYCVTITEPGLPVIFPTQFFFFRPDQKFDTLFQT